MATMKRPTTGRLIAFAKAMAVRRRFIRSRKPDATTVGPARPPRLAVLLLRRVARPQDRDYLLNDVHEEFDRIAGEQGCRAAVRWYWRQALTSASPLLRQRSAGAAPRLRTLFPLGSLADDGRHAWRWTLRNRRLAATLVATLAISLASAIAAMTILHAVLLHPLPFPEPDRLFRLWSTAPDQPAGVKAVSLQDLDDWRRETRGFSAISGWTAVEFTLTGRGEPRRVPAIRAGLDLDRALMIRAAAGRLFEAGDVLRGSHQVVVLSHGFWRREFGGDPTAVGRTLTLDDQSYVIVGVLPDLAFTYPSARHEIWVPLVARPGAPWEASRATGWIEAVGRIAPGVTMDQARDGFGRVVAQLADAYPSSNARRAEPRLRALTEEIAGSLRLAILVVTGAVMAVLLVACGNVTNLLLAHADRRRRAFAVQMAIGAGFSRLARQVAAETLLLVVAGGALGLFCAPLLLRSFLMLYPAAVPPGSAIALTAPVALWSAALMAAIAVAIALPQLRQIRRSQTLHVATSGRTATGRGARRARALLVVGQLAFSVMLVFWGAAFARTLGHLSAIDPGFRPQGVLSFGANPSPSRFGSAKQTRVFFQSVLDSVRAVPGVRSAAVSTAVPFVSSGWRFGMRRAGDPTTTLITVTVASPGYFETLGMRFVFGRPLSGVEQASDARAVVVNERLARFIGGSAGSDVIGKSLRYSDQWWEIVGVVQGARQLRLREEPIPEVYLPWSNAGRAPQIVIVRVDGPPLALLPAIAARVHAIDPATPLANVSVLEQAVGESIAVERFRAALLICLAGVAVLLAALGVSTVTSFTVARQERENGIRVALGETADGLRRRVVLTALRPAVVGSLVGVALSVAAARWLESFLYGVQAHDPLALSAAAGGLVLLAALAAWSPARRAARIDPATALRVE